MDVKRVTDEAHFADDLGADWLDRLELIIEIEAQFPAVEFTDEDVDQIAVVGDLIRHVKSVRLAKTDGAALEAPLQRCINRARSPRRQCDSRNMAGG